MIFAATAGAGFFFFAHSLLFKNGIRTLSITGSKCSKIGTVGPAFNEFGYNEFFSGKKISVIDINAPKRVVSMGDTD